MKPSNTIAFKEWAVVCAALGTGRQTIILRKGGIDEGREGFRVEHDEFWLLPTQFHQKPSQLTSEGQLLWEQLQLPPPEKFRVDSYVVVHDVLELGEFVKIQRLAGEHILSAATVTQRFNYRYPGLFVLIVRVYRIPTAFEIDADPYIAGCKSWVKLPAAHSTAGAQTVLADLGFAQRREALLASMA